jgi:hypothetical protein
MTGVIRRYFLYRSSGMRPALAWAMAIRRST